MRREEKTSTPIRVKNCDDLEVLASGGCPSFPPENFRQWWDRRIKIYHNAVKIASPLRSEITFNGVGESIVFASER